MFDNYLEDESVYGALEQYWVDLFGVVLKEQGGAVDDWQIPYYNTFFANGMPMMDANPIFSARSKVNGRIVRIVQETPEEGEGVRHWIDESESELTVVCVLEEQFIERIKVLIGSWIG